MKLYIELKSVSSSTNTLAQNSLLKKNCVNFEIPDTFQLPIFNLSLKDVNPSSPLPRSRKNNGTRRQRKRLKRHRFFALCPVFPSKGVRKPRKRTMAQSKNRLVLAIKRHALSIHERKTWSTRCTWSRETFVQARLERFEHNVFSPAFADITQGNLARTCGKYIPLLTYTRKSVYYIQPFLPPFISSTSPGIRRGKGGYVSFSSNFPKSVAESFGNSSVPWSSDKIEWSK